MKRFEYSPLGKKLKKQTYVAEKQYQSFDKVSNYDEKEEPVKIQKERPLTTEESSLFYNNKYSFTEFKNVGKYYNLSFTTKCNSVNEFRNFAPRTEKTKN